MLDASILLIPTIQEPNNEMLDDVLKAVNNLLAEVDYIKSTMNASDSISLSQKEIKSLFWQVMTSATCLYDLMNEEEKASAAIELSALVENLNSK